MMSKSRSLILRCALAAAVIAVAFVAPPAIAQNVPESADPIKLALNEWTGQHISTKVAGELLKKMGYNVEYITAGYYPQLSAISDGGITATMEIWDTNVGEGFFVQVENGELEVIGDLGLDAGNGWVYPKYVQEQCPGLPDWQALKDCTDIFQSPETHPSGRFVGYPADWGNTFDADRFKALGLSFVEVPAGSEGALIAEIQGAVARKAPLLIHFWWPHWIYSEVEIGRVELPPYDDACVEDPSWGLNPEATYDCAFKKDRVLKVVWPGTKDKWPTAYRFLKNLQVTNDVEEPLMKAVDVDGRDLDEVVHEWIETNRSRWQPWVEDALKG
jgi:glycine betaine/proline transport system substrate-binding protein